MSEGPPIEDHSRPSNPPEQRSYVPIESTTEQTIFARYEIPEANRHNPVVQEFAHLSAELDTLTDALANADSASRAPNRMSLSAARELFAAPDMSITLADRYAVVNSLLLASREILSEGMYDVADKPREYTLRQLMEATRRLGYTMTVEKAPPVVYRDPDK